jgi:hypothetical protein
MNTRKKSGMSQHQAGQLPLQQQEESKRVVRPSTSQGYENWRAHTSVTDPVGLKEAVEQLTNPLGEGEVSRARQLKELWDIYHAGRLDQKLDTPKARRVAAEERAVSAATPYKQFQRRSHNLHVCHDDPYTKGFA